MHDGGTVGWIYFLRVEPMGLIKIGWTSRHPERRRQAIDAGSPFPVIAIGVIARRFLRDEAKLHEIFGRLRQKGEWFRPGRDLLRYIEHNALPWPDEPGPEPEPAPPKYDPTPPEPLIKPREAAAILGCSLVELAGFRRWCDLPHFRMTAATYMYRRSGVEAWARANSEALARIECPSR